MRPLELSIDWQLRALGPKQMWKATVGVHPRQSQCKTTVYGAWCQEYKGHGNHQSICEATWDMGRAWLHAER